VRGQAADRRFQLWKELLLKHVAELQEGVAGSELHGQWARLGVHMVQQFRAVSKHFRSDLFLMLRFWAGVLQEAPVLPSATLTVLIGTGLFAQSAPSTTPESGSMAGTSNDLFVMFGSDLVRPGLLPKGNYNIGFGHTFKFLAKNPIGDELTFSYTYENAGSHGFLHTDFGSHTEALGIMKNFGLPKTKRITGYTWVQGGLTSMTGNPRVENRFYDGEALGVIIHFGDHSSIWIQDLFNKVVTVPWYTTASIGYTRSW
jgi:hypothetical protein